MKPLKLPGAMGCPCALTQKDLDQLHQLLVRGINHGQVSIGLEAGSNFRFGTMTTRLGEPVRCNGTVRLDLPPGEFVKMMTVMWDGVVMGKNCELVKKESGR